MNSPAFTQENRVVRLAEIEVDTTYLEEYKTAITEQAEAAVRLEPGVITLYAVQEKEHPGRIRVLEIYADDASYQSHLKTPHFIKYKTGTLEMVKSLELIDISPLAFSTKTDVSAEGGDVIFAKGEKMTSTNFSGEVWLKMLSANEADFDCSIYNVTFAKGCRNSWHSHPGGQILLCTAGEGYYQEKGKPAWRIKAGDVVEILPDVVHWHGATPESEFTHIGISTQAGKGAAVWYEPVTDEEYKNLSK
jgi:quercetin dioxygenase-like cupin family protein/quinol monooxygenase YgiN